jgi:hypothetical protein
MEEVEVREVDRPVLGVILAGARTKVQVAERLGVPETQVGFRDSLIHLHLQDLLYMQVIGGRWHYFPTAKAGRLATALAVNELVHADRNEKES